MANNIEIGSVYDGVYGDWAGDPREVMGNRANGQLASSPAQRIEPMDVGYNPYAVDAAHSAQQTPAENLQPETEHVVFNASENTDPGTKSNVQVVKRSDGTQTSIRVPGSLA